MIGMGGGMPDQPVSQIRLPVRFLLWPAQSLRCSLFVVQYGEKLLADTAWVRSVRGSLERAIRADITLLNALGVLNGLMGVQLAENVMSISVPEFIDWMKDLPANHPIWDMSQAPDVPALDPHGEWHRFLDVEPGAGRQPLRKGLMNRFSILLDTPAELRDLTVATCAGFWEGYLSDEYRRLEPVVQRAVALGSQDPSPRSHHELSHELIGRTPIGPAPPDFHSGDILAAPVCHLGAFPLAAHFEKPRWTTVYAFEAERMPAVSLSRTSPCPATFKALGDANRLEIIRLLAEQEMYGLELSKQLDISQPAISKHLRILASEGILKMRRDGLIKYFSVDPDRLDEIADSIRRLKGMEPPSA